MGYQNLLVETRDGITFVTVNRPDKLNALNDRTVEEVDAADALRIGLVNRVVPREKLLAEAEGLLRKMVANGPLSLRFTLEAVHDGLEMGLDEAQHQEATLFGLICTTEDMKEGTKAFLEKRPARVQGK